MNKTNLQSIVSSIGGFSNTVSIPPSLTKQEFEQFMNKNFSSYFLYYEHEGVGDYSEELPKYKLPSFSGASGNIAFLALSVNNALKEKGFNLEAETFFNDVIYNSQKDSNVDAHYNFLKKASKYIDFGYPISWEEYQEIDHFFRKKGINSEIEAINFSSNPTLSYSQIPEFKNIDHSYKKLIQDGFDFSTTNCYGRNALYYCNKHETFKDIVEKTNATVFTIDNLNLALYNNLFDIIPSIGATEGLKILLELHSQLFDKNSTKENAEYLQDILIKNFNANKYIYLDVFPEFFFSTTDNNKQFLYLGVNSDKTRVYFNPIISEIEAIYDTITLRETKELFIDILDKALVKFDIESITRDNAHSQNFENSLKSIEQKFMQDMINQKSIKKSRPLKF